MIGTHISAVARVLAAALQQTQVAPADSVVVESPLPGGIAEVVRFLLNSVPQWVQLGGVVAGAAVAAFVVLMLSRRRLAITGWLGTRTHGVRVALGAAAVVALMGAAGAGAVGWNYMQHANAFCTGCHVMNPAFQRFSSAENKHGKLSCHACHQQSMFASARQMYLWVAERPEKIGVHAKVASPVCKSCHVTGDTAVWQRIAATAGHRVHLESDSSALKDLQCVTCHGVEVHRFKPVNETCGQSNCHNANQTRIVLGKMATQTMFHCAGCHGFVADVPALATRDSARGTLVPGKPQCLGCHEMQKVMAEFDQNKDPHGGKCGTCHNPHTQKTPAAAVTSCANIGCHANWRDEPFHAGENHKKVGPQCLTCHVPHRAKVDPSECQGCHVSVRTRGALRPPVRFDTTKALRRPDTTAPPSPAPEGGDAVTPFAPDDVTPEAESGFQLPRAPPERADSFPHARHAKLACLECHETGAGHGRLTFERPRGCAICHHQAPTPARCVLCHQPEKYGTPMHKVVTVTVPGHAPKPRPVDFLHARHSARSCVECHTTPVTLAPAPEKAQCKDCHSEHHAAGRNCSECHTLAEPKAEHKTLETAHQRCDACHTAATIARLTPTRTFCSTCHATRAQGHYGSRECTVCHFLSEPGAYRAKLITRPPQ